MYDKMRRWIISIAIIWEWCLFGQWHQQATCPAPPEKKKLTQGISSSKSYKKEGNGNETDKTKQQVDNDSRGYLIAQPPIAKINEP